MHCFFFSVLLLFYCTLHRQNKQYVCIWQRICVTVQNQKIFGMNERRWRPTHKTKNAINIDQLECWWVSGHLTRSRLRHSTLRQTDINANYSLLPLIVCELVFFFCFDHIFCRAFPRTVERKMGTNESSVSNRDQQMRCVASTMCAMCFEYNVVSICRLRNFGRHDYMHIYRMDVGQRIFPYTTGYTPCSWRFKCGWNHRNPILCWNWADFMNWIVCQLQIENALCHWTFVIDFVNSVWR